MKKCPLVSIVIVNWNGGKVFEDCLKSLSQISYKNWELILVDNGSIDGSQYLTNKIRLPAISIKLIQNTQNKGFASANNQGYEESSGKYILLLNNDTKVDRDFLSLLVERIEKDTSIGVIQPKIYLMDKEGYLDNAGSFFTKIGFLDHWGFMRKDSKEFTQEKEIFSAKGACLLANKSVVDKVGLFDNDFISYFEESDFCWRVWISGYRVLFYPKAVVYHKLGFTVRRQNVLQINFHYYKNRISSLIKNLDNRNLSVVGVHVLISLGIAFIFIARFRFKNSFMIINSIFWNVKNIRKTLVKRKSVQSLRKMSDKEIFSRVSKPTNWSKFFRDFKRVEKDIENKSLPLSKSVSAST